MSQEPKAPSGDRVLKAAQRLRIKRFAMALTTYAFAIVATALTTRLGLGRMTDAQWVMFIGLALFANTAFFALFLTRSNLRFSDPSMTWIQIESYIRTHSEAEFSHSICPECAKTLYPDLDIYGEDD